MNLPEEQEQFLRTAEERAVRIARLLELIALEKEATDRHERAASPTSIVSQYRELYHERVAELAELMQNYYGLTIHFPAETPKAA